MKVFFFYLKLKIKYKYAFISTTKLTLDDEDESKKSGRGCCKRILRRNLVLNAWHGFDKKYAFKFNFILFASS